MSEQNWPCEDDDAIRSDLQIQCDSNKKKSLTLFTKIENPYLSPCIKINSKGIEGLSVKPGTWKLPEEKNAVPYKTQVQQGFSEQNSAHSGLRPTLDKWELSKSKSFCTAKEIGL